MRIGEEEALQAESRRPEGGCYRPERRPYGEGQKGQTEPWAGITGREGDEEKARQEGVTAGNRPQWKEMPVTVSGSLQSPKKNGYTGYLSFSVGFAAFCMTVSRSIHITGIMSFFTAE